MSINDGTPDRPDQPSWMRTLRAWGPGLPIILAGAVSLFTPVDMVWGVAAGIVLAVIMAGLQRRPGQA